MIGQPHAVRRWLVLSVLATPACGGLGLLQSARTTPRHELRTTVSVGYDRNAMISERGTGPSNLPTQIEFRYGLSDRVDLGLRTFFGLGALADVKGQVVAGDRLAISVRGGAGASYDPLAGEQPEGATVVHVPLALLASYRLAGAATGAAITPYASAGYGAFWIFGYDRVPGQAGTKYADRDAHGDGLLLTHVGVEISITRRIALLAEYAYLRPIVDDAGDNFQFAANHLFLAGLRL